MSPTEEFAQRLVVALRRYGAPTHRLEDAMTSFAERVGLEGQFYVLPSAILTSVKGVTQVVPMSVGPPALERLVAVDQLAETVASGERSAEDGLRELARIEDAPPRYPWLLSWLAPALASAGAVPLFGGGIAEIGVAALVGMTCSAAGLALRTSRETSRLVDVISGAIAAWLVHAAAIVLDGAISPQITLVAGLLVLLPGLTLTVAFSELATRHMISGTAGLVGGTLTLLQLGFGVAVGERLASQLLGPIPAAATTPLPAWVGLVSMFALGAALTVDLQARPRDYPAISGAVGVAMLGASLGADLLGNLGGAVGGFALTATSNALARWLDRPAAVTQVPGILLLVPGSVGFRSVSALVAHDVVGGVETAFDTVIGSLGLVVGILLATALVPPRRAL